MNLVKTVVPGYLKDEQSNVVVNENLAEFELYKAARLKIQEQKENKSEINTLKETVNNLSQDLLEIKKLLYTLTEKK